MGRNLPRLLPLATSLIWMGPWGVLPSASSKLCACVRAHSFRRLCTDILLNRHIVAQGRWQEIFRGGGNKKKSSINY